jgi:hypothetical protein
MNEKQRAQLAFTGDPEPEVRTESPLVAGSVRILRPGTDYLYCSECQRHVPCEPLEGDVWEVQCSRCVGECGLCSCRISGECLDKDGSRVQFHIHTAREIGRTRFNRKEAKDV